jgi:hypothetical protein
MDLTNKVPRSPYDMNAGLVMLPRTTDKAKANNSETLGEYHYNCPMDKELFEFLGLDEKIFAEKVKELETEKKIAEWINSEFSKSEEEKNEFNNKMRHGKPEDEDGKKWLDGEKEKLGRNDYSTFFDHLDADEGRF